MIPSLNPTVLFAISLGAALYMTGVIWFVQLVHYPLFKLVPEQSRQHFVHQNGIRTTWVVLVPMILELFSALYLLYQRPQWFSAIEANLSAGLIITLFASTFFVQVPLHERLIAEGSEKYVGRLVQSNWIRTTLWTLRAGLLLKVVLYTLPEPSNIFVSYNSRQQLKSALQIQIESMPFIN